MKIIKKIFLSFLFVSILVTSLFVTKIDIVKAYLGQPVYNWYIKSLDTTLTLNKDSSLDVIERITADCGLAEGKHGIYRTLPKEIKIKDGKTIFTPIHLISITDFNGHPYKYEVMNTDKTVIWKIGDPNITVSGVNKYLIHYKVDNVVRFGNQSLDEFYWNILGAYWDLKINAFHAKIILPEEVNKDNTKLSYYAGYIGSKDTNLASYRWTNPHTLEFSSTEPLNKKEGITVSLAFPKNIFIPYHIGFWGHISIFLSRYGLWFIPLITLIICYIVWRKYGNDARVYKAIMPIYDVPQNLSPLEMCVLLSRTQNINGKAITAEIISLATRRWLTIKELEKNLLFIHSKDYLFIKNPEAEAKGTLTLPEATILDSIFSTGDKVKLSYLKSHKNLDILSVRKQVRNLLIKKGLIREKGLKLSKNLPLIATIVMAILAVIAAPIFFLIFSLIFPNRIPSAILLWKLFVFFSISFAIILLFALIMPARTKKGAEAVWQIQGFQLFMKTVDKYKARFYEKENIFDKFLPYAILFDITYLWMKKMQKIYGDEYFQNYTPTWYVGNLTSFLDFNQFSSVISSFSSSMGTVVPSGTGIGGVGGVGGGSGGGGGGGW